MNGVPLKSLPIWLLAGVAIALPGCGVNDPRACSVTCGAARACPDGTECGTDQYCHAPDEPANSCTDNPGDGSGIDGDIDDPDGGNGRPDAGPLSFADESAPDLLIPDDSPLGIDTSITADVAGLEIDTVEVHLEISHSWRGDLILTLESPDGELASVVDLVPEDSGLDVRGTFDVIGFTPGSPGEGTWVLHLVDRGPGDIGLLEYWSIGINRPAP